LDDFRVGGAPITKYYQRVEHYDLQHGIIGGSNVCYTCKFYSYLR
jgi:hypothetical protein